VASAFPPDTDMLPSKDYLSTFKCDRLLGAKSCSSTPSFDIPSIWGKQLAANDPIIKGSTYEAINYPPTPQTEPWTPCIMSGELMEGHWEVTGYYVARIKDYIS
jgi:hypothetical protein